MVIKEYDVNELSIGFSRCKSSSNNISCSTNHINIGIYVKINLNHHHISIIVDVKGLGVSPSTYQWTYKYFRQSNPLFKGVDRNVCVFFCSFLSDFYWYYLWLVIFGIYCVILVFELYSCKIRLTFDHDGLYGYSGC